MQNKRENFIIEMKKLMQKYNATITDSGFSDTTICISFKDDDIFSLYLSNNPCSIKNCFILSPGNKFFPP